jgi:nitrate/nitrite-specific signal transduction histidine kinase
MTQATENREPTLADIVNKLDTLTQDVERSNERFANYQQAVQWVVQLAFSLIASATVTIIITSVFRR